MIIAAIVAVVLFVLFIAFLATYKVIPANEAHVLVVMGGGRRIMSPIASPRGDGAEGEVRVKTAYFFIPFLMKREVMPLVNVRDDIKDIQLNDLEMAPFVADVVAWLRIEDPVKAASRLDFTNGTPFVSLHQDLVGIVQAIARTVSMKQEILDIMRDRKTFSTGVSTEVDLVLKEWGIALVNLEVNDIRDGDGSEVIQNYELMRKATIESLARIQVSKKNREAVEAEQENIKLAEIATAESEKAFTIAQTTKDEVIGVAIQGKDKRIAVAEADTNKTKVDALRVLEVGTAEVKKEAAVVTATGEGEALRIKGEKEADVIKLTGAADASAIEAKGLAEATAKLKFAEALQKYNDAGLGIEKLYAWRDVKKAFAEAQGKIAENAEIKLVTSGKGMSIFGMEMNAENGADLGAMIEAMDKEIDSGAVVSTIKKAVKTATAPKA